MIDAYDALDKIKRYWQQLSQPGSAQLKPHYPTVPLYTLVGSKLYQVHEIYLDGGKIVLRAEP